MSDQVAVILIVLCIFTLHNHIFIISFWWTINLIVAQKIQETKTIFNLKEISYFIAHFGSFSRFFFVETIPVGNHLNFILWRTEQITLKIYYAFQQCNKRGPLMSPFFSLLRFHNFNF